MLCVNISLNATFLPYYANFISAWCFFVTACANLAIVVSIALYVCCFNCWWQNFIFYLFSFHPVLKNKARRLGRNARTLFARLLPCLPSSNRVSTLTSTALVSFATVDEVGGVSSNKNSRRDQTKSTATGAINAPTRSRRMKNLPAVTLKSTSHLSRIEKELQQRRRQSQSTPANDEIEIKAKLVETEMHFLMLSSAWGDWPLF